MNLSKKLSSAVPMRSLGAGLFPGRSFSTQNFETFLAKDLTIQRTTQPKTRPANETLVFGNTFSDHMLEANWSAKNGWEKPEIVPYHNLSLEPSVSVFHYAIECFEGMKAYRDAKGKIRLFRPDRNAARFNASSERLSLPTFSESEFVTLCKEFCKVERDWIPSERGYSLYIRPTHISTDRTLGVAAPKTSLMYIISCPVGPYYKEGFNPISLYADSPFIRAFPGGTGNAKLGANYAPTIYAQQQAAKKGCSQVLWLFGANKEIAEVGTMNMMFFWTNKQGERELITPPLDGTILPGVTRDSILSLCRQWGEFKVTERTFSIHEVIEALEQKRVIEAFGCGTAAIVAPVKSIFFEGKDHAIPLNIEDPSAKAGKLTQRLADTIMGIQYGEIPSEWSVVVD